MKMASKMGWFLCVFIAFFACAKGEGELTILHSPDSLKFNGHNKLPETTLKEVFSAALGLSVEQGSDWTGLTVRDPFDVPEAVVEVYVDGVTSLKNGADIKGHEYPLSIDEQNPDTFAVLSHRIMQRNSNGYLINIDLSDENKFYSSIFGDVKIGKVSKKNLETLKPNSVDEDYMFLQELEVLKAIVQSVERGCIVPDNVVDLFFFRLRSLHALSDFHGQNSPQAKEAKRLLGEVLETLTAAFKRVYSGQVLVTVVTSDFDHVRRFTRSLKEAETEVNDTLASEWNLAKEYSADYPVVFNIILWFSVIFAFALIAIVYAIMDMDPGRDSIIYRMTSNRMKKEN